MALSAGIASGGQNTAGMTTVGMTNVAFTPQDAGRTGSLGDVEKKAVKDGEGTEEAVLEEEERCRKDLLDKFYSHFNPSV